MNRALYQAWQQARDTFLRYTNVIGVGRGPKIKGGREVAREAIVVLVDRKLRRANVPKGELIPATFGGFPTDVREPHLTVKRKKFDPNTPPDDPNDECLTDHEWIDWGKIHRLRLEQRRTGGRGTRSRTRGPKGATGDDPADVPTTEVIGNLFVIRDPSQTLVVPVGMSTTVDYIGAYNLLRGTFGDDYDFVSFYIDAGSGFPDVGNASDFVFNSTTGIGWGAENDRPAWGSTRLLRHIHHTWFSLRTLMHEPSHQWLFFVDYRDTPAGATQDLLHQDWVWSAGQRGFHWGRWPDNDTSCLDYDRADWINNGDGTFNRTRHFEDTPPDDVWFGFNSLDQYLMGLTPASTVANVTIVQNPSPAQSDLNPGPYMAIPSTVTVGIDNIQYEEGVRAPDYLNSQRVFHHAVVVITASSASPLAFNTSSETWRTSGALSGSTLLVPAGTEFALLCGCDDELHAATTWIRFCHEARIQIGCRKPGALEQQYGLRGLQPVVVNGLPLLHVSDPREARITLRLRPGERATLQLIGVVSPYRGGQRTTCHITESVAGTIVGGLAVEIGS